MYEDVLDKISKKRAAVDELLVEISELEQLVALAEKHKLTVKSDVSSVLERVRLEVKPTQAVTLREKIVAATERILSDGRRRLSRELLPELENYGVRLVGKDPAGNLSSYLSREKDRFVSDVKAGGWTLCALTQKARTPDVGASRALFNS